MEPLREPAMSRGALPSRCRGGITTVIEEVLLIDDGLTIGALGIRIVLGPIRLKIKNPKNSIKLVVI